MTPVTRYQAADGTLREPIPPRPPCDQWGWWHRFEGRWAMNRGAWAISYDSREEASEALINKALINNPDGDWIVAQYSARPPAPEDAR